MVRQGLRTGGCGRRQSGKRGGHRPTVQSRAEAGGQRDGADGPAQAAGAERCSVRREDMASPVPAGAWNGWVGNGLVFTCLTSVLVPPSSIFPHSVLLLWPLSVPWWGLGKGCAHPPCACTHTTRRHHSPPYQTLLLHPDSHSPFPLPPPARGVSISSRASWQAHESWAGALQLVSVLSPKAALHRPCDGHARELQLHPSL